jgi:D-alanine-D-alanine ligase
MHIAIVHNAVAEDAPPDERDVLVQCDAVRAASESLGHRVSQIPATLDLDALRGELEADRPDVIFNLVESLGGSDRLQTLAPALFDVLGIPYTGVPTEGHALASHKLLAKDRMAAHGLPTPAWEVLRGSRCGWLNAVDVPPLNPPYIVKAVFEHASFGMDDEAVVRSAEFSVQERIARRFARFGKEFFAEAFIPGREFNLSVLAGADGPEVLPPAEIDFSAFPEDKPRIVGYAAKWAEGTFEFDQTPRRFEFSTSDRPLLDALKRLATESWRVFGLRGYARVDFRVDDAGRPWILEINANPCLSPDAGFAAALQQAGISFVEAVRRMVDDALRSVG